jgi:hypothetical protein
MSSVLISSECESATTSSAGLDQNDWVHRWMRTVDQVRASQPHSVAPLVTTHVLLVEQYRYDSSWQTNSNGAQAPNYGNSRGLEIIPNSRMEVQIAPPPISCIRIARRTGLKMFQCLPNFERSLRRKVKVITLWGFSSEHHSRPESAERYWAHGTFSHASHVKRLGHVSRTLSVVIFLPVAPTY